MRKFFIATEDFTQNPGAAGERAELFCNCAELLLGGEREGE